MRNIATAGERREVVRPLLSFLNSKLNSIKNVIVIYITIIYNYY